MAGELVLIVEDNEKNLKLVRDLLQFKGYRTLEAGTAGEGIHLASTHRPDRSCWTSSCPTWMAARP